VSFRTLAVALLAGAALACSSAEPTFSLKSATVDDVYWCPGGARDSGYDLHATVVAHNGTARAVAIVSATAAMKLTTVRGSWLERVGDRYDADAKVAPTAIAANSTATLTVTIPSACTSGRWGPHASSSGTYVVTVRLVTSAGPRSITAANPHQILAA
jgi:hypothetical protein